MVGIIKSKPNLFQWSESNYFFFHNNVILRSNTQSKLQHVEKWNIAAALKSIELGL